MKKLLSIAAVAAIMSVGVNADADTTGTITQTLTILPSAVVKFGAPITVNSNTGGVDRFMNYSIDFNSVELGATPTHQVDVYVQTNVANDNTVQMTITDTTNSGNLVTGDERASAIVMAYAFGDKGSEADITLGTAFDLTTGENNGGTAGTDGAADTGAVGSFTATPSIASNQLAGIYGTILAVQIQAL